MNFLAHARMFVDRPYAAIGSGLPDLTRHLARRARIRTRNVKAPALADKSSQAEIIRGVLAHIDDDTWFHQAPAFVEGTREIAQLIREALAPKRVRASFLAHILLEMVLDAALSERRPQLCDQYYDAISLVDARILGAVTREIVPSLEASDAAFRTLLDRFIESRFLVDYADDVKLVARLSQVSKRVGLDALDHLVIAILPACRAIVDDRFDGLIEPPTTTVQHGVPRSEVSND